MSSTTPIEKLIATTFGISPDTIHDDLGFEDIPEWDSVAHVSLMLNLETAYGMEIDEDLMVELTSVRAIREAVAATGSQ